MDRPEPVDELDRRDLDRSPGVELEFENGMRVLFSPSDIDEGRVLLETESPGGRLMLSPDDGAVAPVAVAAVSGSGLGGHSAVQVRRFLADADAGLSAYVADATEGFSGGASTEDLELMFQLLHLAVTAPAVEPVPFAQQVEFARDIVAEVVLDPTLAADVALADARTGGGRLAAAPSLDQLDALTVERAFDIYRDRFLELDEHVVVVVGDVDEDVVVDLARRYIGTLPEGDELESPILPAPPGDRDIELAVGSGTATGAYRLLVTGAGEETIDARVLAELATSLVNDRGFSVLREELGATYGGQGYIFFEEPGDWIEFGIAVDGDPARIDEIASTVEAELAALADGEIAPADFAEAQAVLATRYEFVNNGFIIESLFDEAFRPSDQVIDRGRQLDALEDIDIADLAAFLDALLDDTPRIDVRNVPATP